MFTYIKKLFFKIVGKKSCRYNKSYKPIIQPRAGTKFVYRFKRANNEILKLFSAPKETADFTYGNKN